MQFAIAASSFLGVWIFLIAFQMSDDGVPYLLDLADLKWISNRPIAACVWLRTRQSIGLKEFASKSHSQ